jgi:hypothetical protein
MEFTGLPLTAEFYRLGDSGHDTIFMMPDTINQYLFE